MIHLNESIFRRKTHSIRVKVLSKHSLYESQRERERESVRLKESIKKRERETYDRTTESKTDKRFILVRKNVQTICELSSYYLQ